MYRSCLLKINEKNFMKALLKFLPIVVFFIVYKYYDIFLATKFLIGLSVAAAVASYVIYRQLDKMMLISNGLLIIFGLLTIKFQDERFLIWKVSIIYWIIAAGLAISTFVMKKSAMEMALKEEITAPKYVWRNINLGMIGFLLLCSVLNLYVGWNYQFDTWFNFKMFGMPVLLIVFFILQTVYLFKKGTVIEKATDKTDKTDIDEDLDKDK